MHVSWTSWDDVDDCLVTANPKPLYDLTILHFTSKSLVIVYGNKSPVPVSATQSRYIWVNTILWAFLSINWPLRIAHNDFAKTKSCYTNNFSFLTQILMVLYVFTSMVKKVFKKRRFKVLLGVVTHVAVQIR